jgi:ABC-type Na+ efflux pump permease subunit
MVIQNLTLVLLIAVIVTAFISFLAALVALYFKDRERAQFIYSIILVILVSATYFLGFSPLNLITVLASGVPHANLSGILLYPVSLAITGILFFKLSRKLVFSK